MLLINECLRLGRPFEPLFKGLVTGLFLFYLYLFILVFCMYTTFTYLTSTALAVTSCLFLCTGLNVFKCDEASTQREKTKMKC